MIGAQVSILLLLLINSVIGERDHSYNPSGWRPSGRLFNPHRSIHHANNYNYPTGIDSSYGPPPPRKHDDGFSTTTTTTTPKTREPTTPTNEIEEDTQSNPALAIANSFAFNRPVYIYTGLPLQPGFTFLK